MRQLARCKPAVGLALILISSLAYAGIPPTKWKEGGTPLASAPANVDCQDNIVCTKNGNTIEIDVSAGSGDITDVFNCASGDCASIVAGATDLLDFSGNDASTATEGLILPQHATACAGGTAEGQQCWEADANILHIGDGATIKDFVSTSAFSGDATVSTTGAVTIAADSVALGTDTTGNYAGSSSEGGAATTATALAANGANCSAGNYPLGVDASGAVESCTAAGGGSGDITDVYNCASGDCASIVMADGDLLDADGVTVNTTTEGILLPIYNAGGTLDGQISWDSTNDRLYVGDGAAALFVSKGFHGFIGNANIGNSDNYCGPIGSTGCQTSEAANDIFESPIAFLASNLHAEVNTAPGAGTSWTVSFRINGVNSSLTCTISGTGTECDDNSNTAAVVAGDTVIIFFDSTGATASSGFISATFQTEPQ